MIDSTASVCLNGHVVCECISTFKHRNLKHCKTCGEPAIDSCPECSFHIPGYVFSDMEAISPQQNRDGMPWVPPNNCPGCGADYPWSHAKSEAIREIVRTFNLSVFDRDMLIELIPHLIKDTPKTELSILSFDQLTSNLSPLQRSIIRRAITRAADESVVKFLVEVWDS